MTVNIIHLETLLNSSVGNIMKMEVGIVLKDTFEN